MALYQRCEAISSLDVNIHSVWQYHCWIDFVSLRKLYLKIQMAKMEDNSPQIGSVQHIAGECISGVSDDGYMQGAQHLNWCKTLLLSVFLFLSYLVWIVTFLSHLLSTLPFWDPDRTLHSLSIPSNTKCKGVENSETRIFFQKGFEK